MAANDIKESDRIEQGPVAPKYTGAENAPLGARVKPEFNFLRRRQVCDRVGCSASTIHRMVADKAFPAPIKLGSMSRWKSTDVEAWMRRMSDDGQT